MGQNKRAACLGALRCAALLALLAFCGASTPGKQAAKTVSVPVTAVSVSREDMQSVTAQEARDRLHSRRQEELRMLDEVIDSEAADFNTRAEALEQKTQIAVSMEKEAQAEAALAYMGCGGAAAVCTGQGITVFAPYAYIADEAERVRMIDCVSMHTGMEAESVKIILAKNE